MNKRFDYKIIRERREVLELSPTELAAKLGISVYSVNRWEAGRSKPQADVLPRLASVLRIPLSRLFVDSDASEGA